MRDPSRIRLRGIPRTGSACFQPLTGQMDPVPQAPGHARVADFRRSHGVVRANAGASLVDLGDGVGCIELHSLKNAIGGDVVSLVSSVLNPGSDAVRDFAAFVITGDRDNFSVGANLLQLLLAAQEGDWAEVDGAIRAFQQMTAAVKFCPRPVVVAPFGMSARRRRGDVPARRASAAVRGDVHRAGGGGGGVDPRRRRHQGDAAARGRCGRRAGSARSQRSPFAVCAVGGNAGRAAAHARDDCDGESVDVGGGRAGAGAACPRRTASR